MMTAISGFAFAQDEPESAYPTTLSMFPPPTIGVELDAFPYLTGGWYGSLWIGYRQIRLRGVLAESYPGSIVTDEGFRDLRIRAAAALVDWFPFNAPGTYEGVWFGAGVEWWRNRVTNEANNRAGTFNSTMATLGGGYVWKFYQHFYVNPWAAAHVQATGGNATIAGSEYQAPSILPEVSVKLGWHL